MPQIELGNAGWIFRPAFDVDEADLKLIGGKKLPTGRGWLLPRPVASLHRLKGLYPDEEIDLNPGAFERYRGEYGFLLLSKQGLSPILPTDLYRYQVEGVQYLLSSPLGGTLLAFEPGLGKTRTAIEAAIRQSLRDPILVVAPLTLLGTWERQLQEWAGITPSVVHGVRPGNTPWVVTNYDTVARHSEWFDRKWGLIIADESVLLKNWRISRYKALAKIRKKAGKVWLLSGSPITKYIDDLYAQFHLIEPQAFTSYWRFVETYCRTREAEWGTEIIGNRRDIRFKHEFRDLVLSKTHKEVLPDLPEALYETYEAPLLPEQFEVYEQAKNDFILQLEGGAIAVDSRLAMITYLQEIVSNLVNLPGGTRDVSAKADLLEELLGLGSIPRPAIIWTHFRKTGQALYQRLRGKYEVAQITAETKDRQGVADAFQNPGGPEILMMSLGVGKFGLTLTQARSMVYYEKSFDGDAFRQSQARVKGRIGLEHRPLIITLRSPKTVDELVERNLRGKMRSIAQLTDLELADLLKGL